MSHELSAAVLVLLEDSSPPPPHAGSRTAETATARRARARFTPAPVYSSRILRRVIAGGVVIVGMLGGSLAQGAGAAPVAHASAFAPCDISGKQQQLGASYVTSLKVQGVGCAK